MKEITLRKFRKLQRLTQEEFGEKLGYKGGYISVMESGKREFSDQFIEKLNTVFNLESQGYQLVRKTVNSHNTDGDGNPHNGKSQLFDGKTELILIAELKKANKIIVDLQNKLMQKIGKKRG